MKRALERVCRFLQRGDGPTSVEYAVMIGLIFLAVITAIQVLGMATRASLKDSSEKLNVVFTGQGPN